MRPALSDSDIAQLLEEATPGGLVWHRIAGDTAAPDSDVEHVRQFFAGFYLFAQLGSVPLPCVLCGEGLDLEDDDGTWTVLIVHADHEQPSIAVARGICTGCAATPALDADILATCREAFPGLKLRAARPR